MAMQKKYIYFISYWRTEAEKNEFGMGNCDITLSHKINKTEDIRKIEKELSEINKGKCLIINYQLL